MDTCINTYCRQAGFEPKIVTVCDDYISIMNFVRSGIGLGFMPESTVRNIESFYPDLKAIKILSPVCCRYINIRWDNQRYLSNAAVEFREFLINHYSQLQKKIDSSQAETADVAAHVPDQTEN